MNQESRIINQKAKNGILPRLLLASCFLLLASAPFAHAQQDSITLTITPPFFQLNMNPGELWSSAIKVVNTNPGDLPVYVTLTDFESTGEEGRANFIPIPANGDASNSLSTWIHLTGGTHFVVPKGESTEIPFTIQVPNDASPDGHYAAVLVRTQPTDATRGSALKISSYISSLFFVRVSGNVVEQGDIREFSSDKTFYSDPNVNFTLRFENKGNVDLHPQGDITVYDMWGKQVGQILVNNDSAFGNVLPRSTRKYDFSWSGDGGLLNMGRYTAVATLTYGENARQNVFETISFWVIPIWETLGILGGSVLFVLFILLIVRWYVRKALGGVTKQLPTGLSQAKKIFPSKAIPREDAHGVIDLRNRGKEAPVPVPPRKRSIIGKLVLIRKYKWFLALLIPLVALIVLWYAIYSWQSFNNGRTITIDPSGGALQQ